MQHTATCCNTLQHTGHDVIHIRSQQSWCLFSVYVLLFARFVMTFLFTRVPWLILVYGMSHLCVCHDSLIYVAWVIRTNCGWGGKNLENISKKISNFSTRRTRIFMGFIISTMLLLGTNRESHGQNSGSLKRNRNNFKNFCHPICNRLYVYTNHSYVCYDSYTCMTWLIQMYDMTFSNVCYDLFKCVIWLRRMQITPCDSFTTTHLHTHTHAHAHAHAHTHTHTCTHTHTQVNCMWRQLSWRACTSCGMTH